MTLRQQQSEFALMVSKLISYADSINIKVFVNEWYRTEERQKQLVAEGKSWTLLSYHIKGLAVDLIILDGIKPIWDNEAYKPLADYWVSIGGIAGHNWKQKDSVHFQYNDST